MTSLLLLLLLVLLISTLAAVVELEESEFGAMEAGVEDFKEETGAELELEEEEPELELELEEEELAGREADL